MKRHRVYWDAKKKNKKCKSWISTESWEMIEERRKLKKKVDGARSEGLMNKARHEHRERGQEVKRTGNGQEIEDVDGLTI